MKAIILGCGPAGLMAAQACHLKGIEFDIFSIKQKSPIFGAQFLHEPIPGMTAEPAQIVFHKVGTREGYATKVYGDPTAPCSWDEYEDGIRPGWSLMEVYNDLWEKFEDKINDLKINQATLSSLEEREADLYISAIPATTLCGHKHRFAFKNIWVERYATGIGSENTVVYNGHTTDPWYRSCQLFGDSSTEYSDPREGDAFQGVKPLWTDCHCRDMWRRVGRFGKWKKGVLTHHAFYQTLSAIEDEL